MCGGTAGLIMMAMSAVSFSILSLLVHVLATQDAVPSFELITIRAIFGLWFGLVWLTCVGESVVPPTGPCRFVLFLRCLFGVLGISCNWFVLTQMPLSDATVIIFTAPLFTALFGQLFLGEKVSAAMGALMALSSVGVLMVARPSFLGFEPDPMPPYASTSRGVAVLIGIGGALSSAMTNLAVRKLLQVHAMVTVSWLFMANLAVAPVLLLLTQTPVVPTKTLTWLIAVGIGIVGFAGQGFKTQGLKWEKAGPGAMMRNLDIVFALIFQVTLLDEPLHDLSLLGAMLTLTCSLGIGLLKRRAPPSTTPPSVSDLQRPEKAVPLLQQ